MSRTFCSTVLAWTIAATLQAAQPGGNQATRSAPAPATAAQRVGAPQLLPGTRPDVFATIKGNALNSMNNPLANTHVRLRDAHTGQIADTQLTDPSGLFTFGPVDPGSYVVEVLSPDQKSVVASSQVLNAGAGEVVTAAVKLPFMIGALAGFLGNSTPSAAIVAAQAAASGVLALQVTGAATCVTVQ
jgi:hypothetical protein